MFSLYIIQADNKKGESTWCIGQVRSILDYDIDIHPLPIEEQTYTALNMNYSVAGFQVGHLHQICCHPE